MKEIGYNISDKIMDKIYMTLNLESHPYITSDDFSYIRMKLLDNVENEMIALSNSINNALYEVNNS